MSATFPYQCDWAPSPTMEPSRLKVAFGDGYEQRASAGLNPFLASYDLAFSVRSEAEANAIYAWLQFNNAHVDPFYWDPTWISTTASGEQFGTGDGARSQWRLSKSGIYVSRDIILDSITREDWQGVVDLSPLSRTNHLQRSQAVDQWAKSGTFTVTANAIAAPDGAMTADIVDWTVGAVGCGPYAFAVSGGSTRTGTGQTVTRSIWLKGETGGEVVNLTDPTVGGTNNVNLTTAWQRFAYAGTAGTGTFGLWIRKVSGNVIHVAYGQVEDGTVPKGYLNNPSGTQSVSITDYTHTSGLISLGQVPVSGAVLRWGGSGKTHLRWIADKWTPPEPVSYNNWRVQATFRQVP